MSKNSIILYKFRKSKKIKFSDKIIIKEENNEYARVDSYNGGKQCILTILTKNNKDSAINSNSISRFVNMYLI